MGKVVLSKSMSLDGFVAGPNVCIAAPMGTGGLRLHDWLLNGSQNDASAKMVREATAAVGAVILGRRTFDVGVDVWEDVPYPVPTFVLTHTPLPPREEKSGTFTFVGDGIMSALEKAQAAADDKDVVLMGAEVSDQFLKAGLVDEIRVSIVPVLFGAGTRLFDDIGAQRIEFEHTAVIEAGGVVHLRLRSAGHLATRR